MAYSKVTDPEFKVKRQNNVPLLDGSGSVQDLGYVRRKTVRFFWISTSELQTEIDALVTDDWTLDGEPSKALVTEAVPNLFNAVANFVKYTST